MLASLQAQGHRKGFAIAACGKAKPDFHLARGAQKNPPRSQHFETAGSERVDKTEEKRNQSGAGRAGL